MTQPTSAGAGPLYPQTPAALAAAERPVHIPGRADDDDPGASDASGAGQPTGERQAAENRENDPPA